MDRATYAFTRGSRMLVVLTAGYNETTPEPRPAAYSLRGLQQFAGTRLCDAMLSGVRCVARAGQ